MKKFNSSLVFMIARILGISIKHKEKLNGCSTNYS
jgi:hypothetical protein